MDENLENQTKSSNRFIFSNEFYDQLDQIPEEKEVSFDAIPIPPVTHEEEIKKETVVEEPIFSTPNISNSNINSKEMDMLDKLLKPKEEIENISSIQIEHPSQPELSPTIEPVSAQSEQDVEKVKVVEDKPEDVINSIANDFKVETGINTDLEKELLTTHIKNQVKTPIVENTPFFEQPSEKMVYRAARNAPSIPTWLQEEIEKEDAKKLEELESIPIHQPAIINIDEELENQKEFTITANEKEEFDYEENLDHVPYTKSNLLDQLHIKEQQTGKISILARYGEDFCSKDYITNPAIGRKEEIKQLILILLTPEKSGILVGKPGIGKTAIVEGLAYQLQRNNVPDALKGYRVVSIKTTSLMGTLPTGETRLQTLIDELKDLDKIILFIDEIHMLMGATSESGLDFANMFKESLGRGSIKMIGATTNDEYERYVLRDKAFVRRFQRVDVEEPNKEQTIKILMGTLPKIEKTTGAKLKYSDYIQTEIMSFIVDITSEYKRVYGVGSRYPDICLTLLSQAFSQAVFDNRKEVTIDDIRNAIQNSKNIYPDVIRKELINFDQKFAKMIQEEQ